MDMVGDGLSVIILIFYTTEITKIQPAAQKNMAVPQDFTLSDIHGMKYDIS
jgi:hypothetical protein